MIFTFLSNLALISLRILLSSLAAAITITPFSARSLFKAEHKAFEIRLSGCAFSLISGNATESKSSKYTIDGCFETASSIDFNRNAMACSTVLVNNS